MTSSLTETIRGRARHIETMPAIPAVFLPLVKLLSNSVEEVELDDVVRLVSYDGAIAAQCLRVAGSPLFGLSQPPKSIKAAVVSLGLRRVETILLTCCLGQAFPGNKCALDPAVFWRHSLGCALVCRKFSEILTAADTDIDTEKAYMAGLLHDIGFMANCLAFSQDFVLAMERANQEGIPLDEAEQATMGFTHCETGQALAEKWELADDIVEVIAHHHAIEHSQKARPLVALVHLSDLLCRMRGLGYGYYERHKLDLIADPAWAILLQQHRDLEAVDLVRFTFELDEAVEEIHALVATAFGSALVPVHT
jgi:putative nucleotidyltransferase with HDIG domain